MNENKINALVGWMIFSLIAIGVLGLFAAFLAFANEFDYIGVGLCLLASAYAFGSVLKAYL